MMMSQRVCLISKEKEKEEMGVMHLASLSLPGTKRSETIVSREREREREKKKRANLLFPIFIQNKTNKSSFSLSLLLLRLPLSLVLLYTHTHIHIHLIFSSVLYLVGFFFLLVFGLMMIIQDENRLKEQEESRMSVETNSTGNQDDIHDLSISNGTKMIHSDLSKSANRRKQNKPNRFVDIDEFVLLSKINFLIYFLASRTKKIEFFNKN